MGNRPMTKCSVCGSKLPDGEHVRFCTAGCEEASWTAPSSVCEHGYYARRCVTCAVDELSRLGQEMETKE